MRLFVRDLMERCIERGYSWDEIEPCIRGDLGGGWLDVDTGHPSYPRAPKAVVPASAGLGDLVAASLARIGITKDFVSKAIGRPCGCQERQAAMNEFGAKYLGLPPGTTSNQP